MQRYLVAAAQHSVRCLLAFRFLSTEIHFCPLFELFAVVPFLHQTVKACCVLQCRAKPPLICWTVLALMWAISRRAAHAGCAGDTAAGVVVLAKKKGGVRKLRSRPRFSAFVLLLCTICQLLAFIHPDLPFSESSEAMYCSSSVHMSSSVCCLLHLLQISSVALSSLLIRRRCLHPFCRICLVSSSNVSTPSSSFAITKISDFPFELSLELLTHVCFLSICHQPQLIH